jgi:sugar O-acyltransferase (sialic acid O-acetyltransferase NeuD family)
MITENRLIFVGAGSLARELSSWIKVGTGDLQGYRKAGFLSDDPRTLDGFPQYVPGVVSSVDDYRPQAGDLLVMAISNPAGKLRVAGLLDSRGGRFLTFIHPSVHVADWVKIGRGVVICPNALVSCHVEIDDFATINVACTIGHDVKVGRGVTLSAHVDLTGGVTVEEGAFFGSHASVLPRGRVGAYAKVGAGTVVLRSVKPGAVVMGVPAKQISP